MIEIKSAREIASMRRAGQIAGKALRRAGDLVAPGVTTQRLEDAIRETIFSEGATSSFLGYDLGWGGFPACSCISVNEEVIHGIPGHRRLREGDIVSIDVGAVFEGYHGDTAATFPVGKVSAKAAELIRVTRACFFEGLAQAREGKRIGDISRAVHRNAQENGCGVVYAYTGHGVGKKLHEEPEVPNVDTGRLGPRLLRGMTIAIEPMINAGTGDIRSLRNAWPVVTADGRLSAHYEHTVLITAGEPELLTWVGEDGSV